MQGLDVVSLAEYEARLRALIPAVERCAAQRNQETCNPGLAGRDAAVEIPSLGRRAVRFDWLRNLLERAQTPDNDRQSGDDAGRMLLAAVERLKGDLRQAQNPAAARAKLHPNEHEILRQVLSESIYQGLNQNPARSRTLEKLAVWLNKTVADLSSAVKGMSWLARVALAGFFAAAGALLAVMVIRSGRRLGMRLNLHGTAAQPDGPPARKWEHWWRDADDAAARGEWRAAIHCLYWAVIARLEEMRLWPADQAKTPREYLNLLGKDDPRRGGLLALTQGFERVWYGGRAADEAMYRSAAASARELTARAAQAEGGR
jgi:hypothetical protein